MRRIFKMNIDSRQIMIVLQNSMAHATAISIHNSKGKEVDVDEVIKLAKKITKEVINAATKTKKAPTTDADVFKQASKYFDKE